MSILCTHVHTTTTAAKLRHTHSRKATTFESNRHCDRRSMILLRKIPANWTLKCCAACDLDLFLNKFSFVLWYFDPHWLWAQFLSTHDLAVALSHSLCHSGCLLPSLSVCVSVRQAGISFIANQTVFNLFRRCVKHHPFGCFWANERPKVSVRNWFVRFVCLIALHH